MKGFETMEDNISAYMSPYELATYFKNKIVAYGSTSAIQRELLTRILEQLSSMGYHEAIKIYMSLNYGKDKC